MMSNGGLLCVHKSLKYMYLRSGELLNLLSETPELQEIKFVANVR